LVDHLLFLKGKDASFPFAHEEYICDITSEEDFQILLSEPINAGNERLFPLLSQFAVLFEEQEFRGLIFEIRSLCSDSTTALGLGSINLSTDYDSYDDPPGDKQDMDALMFATSDKPTKDQIHPIECAPTGNVTRRQYVVPGLNSDNADAVEGDLRLDSLGWTTLAVDGQPTAGQVIGELWVSYDVKFFRPVLNAGNSNSVNYTQHTRGTVSTAGIYTFVGSTSNQTPGFTVTTSVAGDILITNDPASGGNGITGGFCFAHNLSSGDGLTGFSYPTLKTPQQVGGTTGAIKMLNVLTTGGVAYSCSYDTSASAASTAFSTTGISATSTCYVEFTGIGVLSIPICYSTSEGCYSDLTITSYSTEVMKKRRGFKKNPRVVSDYNEAKALGHPHFLSKKALCEQCNKHRVNPGLHSDSMKLCNSCRDYLKYEFYRDQDRNNHLSTNIQHPGETRHPPTPDEYYHVLDRISEEPLKLKTNFYPPSSSTSRSHSNK